MASGTNAVALPKCGVKQCGLKMWRQTHMWRQGEMWRQTMWCQNVVSDTALTKQSFMKCVFSGRRKSATLYACARSLSARDVAISASGRSKMPWLWLTPFFVLNARVPSPSNPLDRPSRNCVNWLLNDGVVRREAESFLSSVIDELKQAKIVKWGIHYTSWVKTWQSHVWTFLCGRRA